MSDLLKLTQWLSPSFPVGSFAYSHGLEQAIIRGDVRDGDGLADWLGMVLRYGAGRSDAILLSLVLRGCETPERLAEEARALCGSAERWQETLDQGRAFARACGALTRRAQPVRPYPVAVGYAAAELDLPVRVTVSLYLHAFAANLVSAAIRFMPLGQAAGARVLGGLHPLISELAEMAETAGLEDITTAAFAAEMAAMEHEHLETRIFRT